METWITCGGETSSLSAKEDFTDVRVEVAFSSITEEVSAGVTSSSGVTETCRAGKEAEASVCECREETSTRGGGETLTGDGGETSFCGGGEESSVVGGGRETSVGGGGGGVTALGGGGGGVAALGGGGGGITIWTDGGGGVTILGGEGETS